MEETHNSQDSAAAEGSHPMDFLLNEDLSLELPSAGDIRRGEVVEHLKNALLIDIGAKSEGIISGSELDSLSPEELDELAVGNEVEVFIVNPEDEEGNVILSYAKAAEERDWRMVQELADNGDIHEARVIGHNKGGLLLDVGRLRGFMPISQLGPGRSFSRDQSTAAQLQKLVGQKLKAKVIEVDRSRNRLILSERAATREKRAAQREELLAEMEEGEVRQGRVVNLTHFGAFVDIGGLEGLVHISELSWKRIAKPGDVVQLGDQVEVYILDVDQERERVALSLKRLQTDPWTIVDEIYQEGQLVEATITKLAQFGAFARIEDEYELEGLVHISELSDEHVDHPREFVRPDQSVTLRIIRVDPEQRQIGLSLKQVSSPRFMETDLAMAMEDADDIFGESESDE